MDNSNGKINLNHDYQIKINVIDFPFILALILTEIKYVCAPREYFYIVLCYLFLRDKKVTIKELVVIEILAWYYAAVTSSRTTFYMTGRL